MLRLAFKHRQPPLKTYLLEFKESLDFRTAFSAGIFAILEFTTIEQRKVLKIVEAAGNTLLNMGEQQHLKMPEVENYLKRLIVPLTFQSDQTLVLVPNADLFFYFSYTLSELMRRASATQETRTVLAVSVRLLMHFDSYIREGRGPESRGAQDSRFEEFAAASRKAIRFLNGLIENDPRLLLVQNLHEQIEANDTEYWPDNLPVPFSEPETSNLQYVLWLAKNTNARMYFLCTSQKEILSDRKELEALNVRLIDTRQNLPRLLQLSDPLDAQDFLTTWVEQLAANSSHVNESCK